MAFSTFVGINITCVHDEGYEAIRREETAKEDAGNPLSLRLCFLDFSQSTFVAFRAS